MSDRKSGRPRFLRPIVRPRPQPRRGWCSFQAVMQVLLLLLVLAALAIVVVGMFSLIPVENTFQQVAPTMGIMQP